MPFDAAWIRPIRGQLYGYVFENPHTGCPLDLYWNLFVGCAPIQDTDLSWHAAILCDWLTFPVARWPELDGQSLGSVRRREIVEPSFYLDEHHDLRLESLSLTRVPDTTSFRVSISGRFDLDGFDELNGADIAFATECEVAFERVIVSADRPDPPLADADCATALLSRFLDPRDFLPPTFDGSQYLFAPRRAP